MNSQSHYVCRECVFLSSLPGTCQNDTCILQGTRLLECHCQDGEHSMVLHKTNSEITQNISEQNEDAQKNDYSVNTLDLDASSNSDNE